MQPDVLRLARDLVRRVVQELMDELARQIRTAFSGAIDRRARSPLPYSRNFDPKRTLRDNLRFIDPTTGKLVVRRPFFHARTHHQRLRWELVILVDQSGSMLDSVIHAAVTAACFWRLPQIRTVADQRRSGPRRA